MTTKTCTKCHLDLPVDNYSFRVKRLGRRHQICKTCTKLIVKNHYSLNREKRIGQIKLRQEELRQFVSSIKSDTPCFDCGGKFNPWQMDFDHIDSTQKIMHIAGLVTYGNKELVLKEIEKCQLVCSNCHRNRTHFRKQYESNAALSG